MGGMSQEEINISLLNEVKALKDELVEWETGQRQTSQHYNAYRDRGEQIYEKDQRIEELEKTLQFYADENSYVTNIKGILDIEATVMIDKGNLAREILQSDY